MSKVETVGNRRLFWVLLVGACVLAVLPIWMTTVPPLHDFPTHLARAHILTTYAQSPDLQRFYLVHWVPVPNLAIDLIVGGLRTSCRYTRPAKCSCR